MRFTKYTLDQLKDAVQSSLSIREALTKLGLAAKGGNYKTFNRAIKNHNIDTSHFVGQGWSNGKIIGPKRDIQDYLNNKAFIASDKLKKRLIREGYFEAKCMSCESTTWMGQQIPLELDHINGNSTDNTLTNLRVLCPNCHALTDNYRGKNIRNGTP